MWKVLVVYARNPLCGSNFDVAAASAIVQLWRVGAGARVGGRASTRHGVVVDRYAGATTRVGSIARQIDRCAAARHNAAAQHAQPARHRHFTCERGCHCSAGQKERAACDSVGADSVERGAATRAAPCRARCSEQWAHTLRFMVLVGCLHGVAVVVGPLDDAFGPLPHALLPLLWVL